MSNRRQGTGFALSGAGSGLDPAWSRCSHATDSQAREISARIAENGRPNPSRPCGWVSPRTPAPDDPSNSAQDSIETLFDKQTAIVAQRPLSRRRHSGAPSKAGYATRVCQGLGRSIASDRAAVRKQDPRQRVARDEAAHAVHQGARQRSSTGIRLQMVRSEKPRPRRTIAPSAPARSVREKASDQTSLGVPRVKLHNSPSPTVMSESTF